VGWCIALITFVQTIPSAPQTSAQKSDVIVVLTGGEQRLEHGLKRWVAGAAPVIYISGVGDGITNMQIARAYGRQVPGLRQMGLQNMVVDDVANSTITNASETKAWLQERGYKTVRLVTANYHMPRAEMLFSETMPDLTIIPDPAFPDDFNSSLWMEDLRSFALVMSEFHKYVASWLHFRFAE